MKQMIFINVNFQLTWDRGHNLGTKYNTLIVCHLHHMFYYSTKSQTFMCLNGTNCSPMCTSSILKPSVQLLSPGSREL
jgi:hypothetical protein